MGMTTSAVVVVTYPPLGSRAQGPFGTSARYIKVFDEDVSLFLPGVLLNNMLIVIASDPDGKWNNRCGARVPKYLQLVPATDQPVSIDSFDVGLRHAPKIIPIEYKSTLCSSLVSI